jgi:hypothetical protein
MINKTEKMEEEFKEFCKKNAFIFSKEVRVGEVVWYEYFGIYANGDSNCIKARLGMKQGKVCFIRATINMSTRDMTPNKLIRMIH